MDTGLQQTTAEKKHSKDEFEEMVDSFDELIENL